MQSGQDLVWSSATLVTVSSKACAYLLTCDTGIKGPLTSRVSL